MSEWVQLRAKAWKWRYISDNNPNDWKYNFVALFKHGNDYFLIDSPRPRYAKAYEFAYDEKMRAIKCYEDSVVGVALSIEERWNTNTATAPITEDDVVTTPEMVSWGYIDEDNELGDGKPIAQLYWDKDYKGGYYSSSEGRNDAIRIPPLRLMLKTEKKPEKKEIKYEEYEQGSLF